MTSLTDPRCAMGTELLVIGATVEVVVGADESIFYVHERLLRSTSEFFKAALSKEWKGGQARKVELPDDSVCSFEGYTRWLYTGKLAVIESGKDTEVGLLASLYGFGEKIIDEQFQNCVIDALVAATRTDVPDNAGGSNHWYPTKGTVDSIYRITPKGSPARRLMVDMHTINAQEAWIDVDCPEQNNHEFLIDLAISLLNNRSVCKDFEDKHDELENGTPCSYHKHSKGETCAGNTSSEKSK
ncbi:hypothetical protein LTR33_005593 [Friedmanniomyces endolithicus]|nr:hypothetical protein LTR33_005593 [Friedmanniomyces endolithicus]